MVTKCHFWKRGFFSLRQKLILCFVLVAVFPTLVILGAYYHASQTQLRQWLISDSQHQLEHAIDLVDTQALTIDHLLGWINQQAELQNLLELPSKAAKGYTQEHHALKEQLRSQVYNGPLSAHIRALFVLGENGLDLRCGPDAALIQQDRILDLATPLIVQGIHWRYLSNSLTPFPGEESAILYCAPLKSCGENQGGILAVIFSQSIFHSVLPWKEGETRAISLYNGHGQLLYTKIGTAIPSPQFFRWGHELTHAEEDQYLFLTARSARTAWTVSMVTPPPTLGGTDTVLRSLGILLLVLYPAICALAVFLSLNLSLPIERLQKTVRQIASGKFPGQPPIPRVDEIGQLQGDIYTMGVSLQQLMREQLQSEQEKQQLEMQVLLAQMNPHFLLNTLNSIKIMASMQGKTSISMMVAQLSLLLHANMEVSVMQVPLQRELELLESYLYIQNIRLNGKLHYTCHIKDEEILAVPVLKFMLQPLAENAILHGLREKPYHWRLDVSACFTADALKIMVSDNGVGMDAQTLHRLQTSLDNAEGSERSAQGHGIALSNVMRRLKLYCGPHAYLHLDSVPDQGTTVTICIPQNNADEPKGETT